MADEAFYMPQLDRYRRIWIYLPEGYARSAQEYPVIYMHDGQNLFDDSLSFSGSWKVHETLNELRAKCIVVGIDNGGDRRICEYCVHDTEEHGKAQGTQYLRFITETLKPFVDTTWRTLTGREHTYIAGSSMGGLISFYAGLYFPQVFGNLIVFSPSFWIVPGLEEEVKSILSTPGFPPQHYYFYAGGKEGKAMTENLMSVTGLLKASGQHKVETRINPEGEHTESIWKEEFRRCYKSLKKQPFLF